MHKMIAVVLAVCTALAMSVSAAAETAQEWRLSLLDSNGQQMYGDFSAGLLVYETSIVSTFEGSAQDAFNAFGSVTWMLKKQTPAVFWMNYSAQSCTATGSELTFAPSFSSEFKRGGSLDVQLVKDAQSKIEQTAQEIGTGESTYETVKLINKWLCAKVQYSYSYSNHRTYEITGSLIDRSAACEGFAKAFQYLCERAGINCVVVSGKGTNWGRVYDHAWNYVQMDDGGWYLVDPTWNNLSGEETWLLLGAGASPGGTALLRSHAPDDHGYPELSQESYSAAL